MILLLFFVATTLSQESDTELDNQKLIAQLTACWVVSVQELSQSQQTVNSIISSNGNINRQSIFYKIQTQMLEECVTNAPQEDLDQIIRSISEDVKGYKSFKEIVPQFNYSAFNGTYNWNFTKTDETLLKYIKVQQYQKQHFESWVDGKKPEVKNQTDLNAKKESVFAELKKKLTQMNKQAKENEIDTQQLEKLQFYQQKQKSMKDPMNYVYALIIVSVFGMVFFVVYKKVKNTNIDPRLEKKNKKKKND